MAINSSLLTLVFTDLGGSTALKSRLGDHEAGALITRHQQRVRQLLRETGGREVDCPGDGFFFTFETPSAAVTFALRLQQIHHAEPELPAVRIGVHLGEVSEQPAPSGASKPVLVEGLAVDLAARIGSLAQPGQVLMSAPVFDAAQQRLKGEVLEREIRWGAHGSYRLKGIRKPVEIGEAGFEGISPLRAPPDSEKARRARLVGPARPAVLAMGLLLLALGAGAYLVMRPPGPAGAPLAAIAVLPFEDLSPGGDQAWLANGMADALIEALSRIEALLVPGRTSTQILKQRKADIRTIGEQLGVGSVVEGSVRRSGDDVRISAQVLRASDGFLLWSARYDGKLADLFVTQEQITTEIAEAIRVELGVKDRWSWEREGRYAPRDVRAYELASRGALAFEDSSEERLRQALSSYQQALEIDPSYAQAHALAARTHWMLGFELMNDPEDFAQARAAAERGLELDNSRYASAWAHGVLGTLAQLEWEWEAALSHYRLALEQAPGYGGGHFWYGQALAELGELDDAIAHMRRAVELDPFGSPAPSYLVALLYFAGDLDAAIEQFERHPELTDFPAWLNAALAYHAKGLHGEALETVLRAYPRSEEKDLRNGFEKGGWMGLLRAAIDARVAPEEPCAEPPVFGAYIYAHLGESDLMLDCLDLVRFTTVVAKLTPAFDPYREDPRFQALVRKWQLEEPTSDSE